MKRTFSTSMIALFAGITAATAAPTEMTPQEEETLKHLQPALRAAVAERWNKDQTVPAILETMFLNNLVNHFASFRNVRTDGYDYVAEVKQTHASEWIPVKFDVSTGKIGPAAPNTIQ